MTTQKIKCFFYFSTDVSISIDSSEVRVHGLFDKLNFAIFVKLIFNTYGTSHNHKKKCVKHLKL